MLTTYPMEHEGTLPSGDETLFYHTVTPHNPKAVLILIHGLSEHGGRYRKLQNELSEAGFASWAYDQRGFGQSTGARTDIADYNDFLRDLKNIVSAVKQARPNLKCCLIGHSLGGAVVSAFCIAYPDEVDAIVLSAPAYDVTFPPRHLRWVGTLLSFCFPQWSIHYSRRPNQLSHDPKIDRAMNIDPLAQSAATPRFYSAFQKMNQYLHQYAKQIILPTLILQGTADAIVIPEGAKKFYEAIGSKEKHLIFYNNFYHECFNEIGREQVVSDMIQWLHSTLDSSSSG